MTFVDVMNALLSPHTVAAVMASHVGSKPLSPIKKCVSRRINKPLAVQSESNIRCPSTEPEVTQFSQVSAINATLDQLLTSHHVESCRHHGYRIGATIARRPHLQVCIGEVTEEKIKSDCTVAAIVERMPNVQVMPMCRG